MGILSNCRSYLMIWCRVSVFCGAWLRCGDLDKQGNSLGMQEAGIMELGEIDKIDDPKKIVEWED